MGWTWITGQIDDSASQALPHVSWQAFPIGVNLRFEQQPMTRRATY